MFGPFKKDPRKTFNQNLKKHPELMTEFVNNVLENNPDLAEKITANASDSSNWRSQIGDILSGNNFTGDTLHNITLDFGYPESLSFTHYWNFYRRFGIAKNICDLPVDVAWMTAPEITSEDEGFVTEFEGLVDQVSFWQRLVGLDKRQRVGRYAGMFMQVRDGSPTLAQPIDKNVLNGPASLVRMVPVYEGQLDVLSTDQSPTSENFGLPTMYQLNTSGTGNRDEHASASVSIHPDRLIIAAEGADDGGIYGVPTLEAPYNSLMDLRKIIGGGAEGFYKNAAQSVIFDLKETSAAKVNTKLLDDFNDKFDEFQRDRYRRAMWTPGMESKTLEASSFAQPKQYFDNALNDVAAAAKQPATTIIGQQTGRLASNEDSRSLLSMANSRNENYGTDLVRSTIDWCQDFNILRSAEYVVEWADLLALSMQEKLANALKMAEANAKQDDAGGESIFTGEEIRSAAGFNDAEEDADFVNDFRQSETDLNNARGAESLSKAITNFVTLGGEDAVELEAFLRKAGFSEADVQAGIEERDRMGEEVEPDLEDGDDGGDDE